jgi:hypothetical protein
MESTILELAIPIKDGNDEVKTLTFKRPTAADFAAMDEVKGQQTGTQVLLSRCCNLPMKIIRQLDGYDLVQASEIIGGFLQSAPKTGGTH